MNKQIHLILVATALVLGVSAAAQATIIQTNDSSLVCGAFPGSSSDLVNAGAPTLGSLSRNVGKAYLNPGTVNDGRVQQVSWNGGRDGSQGEFLPATFWNGSLPYTYTFNLNTTINTLGYDITQVDSFAGWDENSRSLANQIIEVRIHRIGGSGYDLLGRYENVPFAAEPAAVSPQNSETRVRLTNDGGGVLATGSVSASGVDSIQVTYIDTGIRTSNAVDGLVVQEIDIIGSPTAPVPEPSTVAILITGLLGLVYVWRKRK